MGLFLALVMLIGCLPFSIIETYAAEGDVKIDETNFPDASFRRYVTDNFDKAEPKGVLSKAELDEVKKIDVERQGISNLKGIEFFKNLEELHCYGKKLKSLDVSKNTALKVLECGYNQLTSLDVSNNTALTTLHCFRNQLKTLDVSNNKLLKTLNCLANQLTSLDVRNNTALTALMCGNNQLTSLDVSKNTLLEHLACQINQLTSLDVRNNTALTGLNCNNNQLKTLDASNNKLLETLMCENNQLTSLDVRNNTALTTLNCNNNQLKTLDVSKNPELIELQGEHNQLTTLDVSESSKLDNLRCSSNQLTTLKLNESAPLSKISLNQKYPISVPNGTSELKFPEEFDASRIEGAITGVTVESDGSLTWDENTEVKEFRYKLCENPEKIIDVNVSLNKVDNPALDIARAYVSTAEGSKTNETYNRAKEKVDALAKGSGKAGLETRLAAVEKYIKADTALKDLENEETKNLTEQDFTEAGKLVNQVKAKWKEELNKRLTALKEKKAAYDKEKAAIEEATKLVEKAETDKTQDAYDAAKAKVEALQDGTEKQGLQDRLTKVEKAIKEKAAIEEATKLVEKAETDKTQDAYDNAKAKVEALQDGTEKQGLKERLTKVEKAIKEKAAEEAAEKAVKDLEDKKGKVTDEEISAAKEKVEKVTDPTKKKDLQDRLDKVKEDKKKVDDEKAAEEAAEKAVKDLEDKKGKVTDEEISAAKEKVEKVTDPTKKKDLQDRLDKVKEDKKKVDDEADELTAAKEDAKNTIKALENLTDQEKAPFNKQVDDATTIPEVEKAVLDAQKADAKKKVEGMNNLSPTDKQTANDAIDNATNKGEVDKAVDNAQNQNDQAADPLAKAKENAKKIINGLDKLTPEEKDSYNGRIDNAQNQQDIDAIVLEAQKENAKKKIAGMDKLTDDERGEADQAIDNAHNNDDINNTVNDAQQKQNDRQSLEEHKAKAKEKVNNLDKLTPEEKDGYNGRIDQAQTKEDVDKIVLEAQKENAKKKIAEMDNLTDDDRREANQNIDNARNEDEINDAVENAGRRVEPTPSYPRYEYNPFWNIYFGSSAANKTTTTPQPQTSVKIKLQSKLVIGSKEMTKTVDGVEQKVMMDIAPFIDSNRTMLPIRFVAEALGFKVEWDDPSRTVILTDKDNVVRIPVDTNKIIVNGNEYESDVKPVLRNNRTMLPIGNIARALGLVDGKDIIWDAATRTVVIKREIEK